MIDTLSETTDGVPSVAMRPGGHRPGRRRRVIAIGVVVALVGIAAGLWVADPLAGPKAAAPIASDPTSLAQVTRQSLSSQTQTVTGDGNKVGQASGGSSVTIGRWRAV